MKTNMKLSTAQMALATVLAAFSVSTSAHIVLEQNEAVAGSYYKAVFKVGHGCSGSATTGIRVFLPEGVHGAKPMPKPGWALSVTRARLKTPHVSHGKTHEDGVSELSWQVSPAQGGQALADEQYDEFVMQVQLPSQTARVAFRVLQTCEQGQIDWSEVADPRQPTPQLKYPAPLLLLQPAGHDHHKH
jgi:periplasmic copper chaperone A